MAKKRILSPEQKAKYDKILANKGKEAADAYKQKIADGGGKDEEPATPEPKEPNGEPRPPKRVKLSKEGRDLKKGIKESTKIGDDLGLFDPNLISSPGVSALVDPNNPAFIGKKSGEELAAIQELQSGTKTNPDGSAIVSPTEQSGLDVLQKAIEEAGLQSPDVTRLLGTLQKNYEEAGVRSPEMAEALGMMKDNISNAGKEDARLTAALSVMEQGLMGLNSPENQALREKSQREVKGKLASAQRSLEDSLARNKVTGGASLAAQRQLDQMGIQGAQQAEQDLLLANVDIQDKRRKDYSDTLMTNDTNKKSAVNAAMNTYGSTLTTDESTRLNAKNNAAGLLSNATTADDASRRSAKVNAASNYGSTAAAVGGAAEQRLADARKAVAEYVQKGDYARAEALIKTLGLDIDISQFNSNAKTASQGQKVSFYSGAEGIKISKQTAKATEKLAAGGSDGGGGGGGAPDPTGINQRIKDIEDTVKKQGR